MATLFVRHQVADFAAWKSGYEKHDSLRKEHGVTSDGVYQSADDANDITVYHEFDTMEAAKAFAAMPELKDAMAELGVTGAPQIWFTNRI
jgi:quinol monooxygenase YgiN